MTNARPYTKREHREHHRMLHAALDTLLADFLRQHPDKRPSTTTCMELLTWSATQTQDPTDPS